MQGLQPTSVARSHLEFMQARGATWRFIDDARRGLEPVPEGNVLATFCLDVVDQAHAPGVSAPSTGGLDVGPWLEAAEHAGRMSSVRSVDVVELSPPLDRDGRTGRLAAATVWRVLRGFAEG